MGEWGIDPPVNKQPMVPLEPVLGPGEKLISIQEIQPKFVGLHRVMFLNGKTDVIDIDHPVYDREGRIAWLVTFADEYINYNTVMSTRKVEE